MLNFRYHIWYLSGFLDFFLAFGLIHHRCPFDFQIGEVAIRWIHYWRVQWNPEIIFLDATAQMLRLWGWYFYHLWSSRPTYSCFFARHHIEEEKACDWNEYGCAMHCRWLGSFKLFEEGRNPLPFHPWGMWIFSWTTINIILAK